jgi:carbamate kinase
MLTDVAHVERDWGTATAAPLETTTPGELRALQFAAGSMRPKVEAACRFVELTGRTASIGALADLRAIVAGTTGTQVVPAPVALVAGR